MLQSPPSLRALPSALPTCCVNILYLLSLWLGGEFCPFSKARLKCGVQCLHEGNRVHWDAAGPLQNPSLWGVLMRLAFL